MVLTQIPSRPVPLLVVPFSAVPFLVVPFSVVPFFRLPFFFHPLFPPSLFLSSLFLSSLRPFFLLSLFSAVSFSHHPFYSHTFSAFHFSPALVWVPFSPPDDAESRVVPTRRRVHVGAHQARGLLPPCRVQDTGVLALRHVEKVHDADRGASRVPRAPARAYAKVAFDHADPMSASPSSYPL